jgi:hypothetical protein
MGRVSGPNHAARCAVLLTTLLVACGGGGGSIVDSAGGGGSNNPTTPTTPTTPSTGSLVGGWSGTTSQGRPYHFLINENGVVLAMIGWSVTSGSCSDIITQFFPREPPLTPVPVTNGAFTLTYSGTLGTLTSQAALTTAGTASGTLAVTSSKCSSSVSVTWTATRAGGAEVNLSGTWNANFASNLVSRTNGTLALSQSGTTVSGTYNVATGAGGTFTGIVSGRMASFALTQTTPGCTGNFSGHAAVMPSPETLVYYYTGTDCLGAHSGGNGIATRP